MILPEEVGCALPLARVYKRAGDERIEVLECGVAGGVNAAEGALILQAAAHAKVCDDAFARVAELVQFDGGVRRLRLIVFYAMPSHFADLAGRPPSATLATLVDFLSSGAELT